MAKNQALAKSMAIKTYRCVAWWNVQWGSTYNLKAESPEAALAKFKAMQEEDTDGEDGCFYEHSEAFDDSDGPTTLEVWDEGNREIAAQEPSQQYLYEQHGGELVAALEAILFQVVQGPVLERDACITQARAAIAKAKVAP